ncbi:MAG: DUF763 domain-containing protein [Thermoplasmata archaeon]|nr:DUF763 domain-containing protein [Thermoplasmata archaeon]
MQKTGYANLPLHYGHAPKWLFPRMVKLSGSIITIINDEYGKTEVLRRLSNPYFFQAFSMVVGFDWHSSGTTTVLMGAIKEALSKNDIGIKVVGGKGKISLNTPNEIRRLGEISFINDKYVDNLIYASRISAKVDNTLIQDGFNLYFHTMIITEKGDWAVIQQGMNSDTRYARRYHWLGDIKSFVEEPHSGIASDLILDKVLDLTAKESEDTRKISLEIAKENPEKYKNLFIQENKSIRTLDYFNNMKYFTMPWKINWENLRSIYEFQPKNYEELISLKNVGPSTVRALAYIGNIIFGKEPSWKDPVKYSFALGGKDGVPKPVDRKAYDESISFLEKMLEGLDYSDRKIALEKLKNLVP